MKVTMFTPVIQPPPGPPRAEGVHWSRLIRSMAVAYGKLDPKWVDDASIVEVRGDGDAFWDRLPEDRRLAMSMGLAWEAWYLNTLPNVIHQPGEMCLEGVHMNQDGEELTAHVVERRTKYITVVHEVKLTYKSTNSVPGVLNAQDIEREWLWQMQMKGYCKAKNTTHACLHVLFVAGDYSRPLKPVIRGWRMEYDQVEVDDAWSLAMSYRHHHEAQMHEDLMRDTEDANRG